MTNSHILFLDEPSNHLDIKTVDSLIAALNNFKGGLVIISHDQRLITKLSKSLLILRHNTHGPVTTEVKYFDTDSYTFDDYKHEVLTSSLR